MLQPKPLLRRCQERCQWRFFGGSCANRSKAASTPAPGPSSTSAQQAASQTSTGAKADANGSVKKTTKTKTPKTPGTTKPKQKRRANQANAQDELVYRPAPSTAGGNIGAAPDSSLPAMLAAAGGGRKAVPELVLPFQLPFVDVRPEMPMLDNASVHAAMAMGASETSSPDTGSDSDDYSVLSDASDLDSEAEESRREVAGVDENRLPSKKAWYCFSHYDSPVCLISPRC